MNRKAKLEATLRIYELRRRLLARFGILSSPDLDLMRRQVPALEAALKAADSSQAGGGRIDA